MAANFSSCATSFSSVATPWFTPRGWPIESIIKVVGRDRPPRISQFWLMRDINLDQLYFILQGLLFFADYFELRSK